MMIKTGINTIREIESIDQATASAMAQGHEIIKDHDVYFVDFGGYFGYSALVFAEGRHIYHANDYALHHRGKAPEELRSLYADSLSRKLFTEAELIAPASGYDEIDSRRYYLQNYYGMRRPYVSMFQIFHSDEEENAFDALVSKMIFNPVCFAYYDDREFVRHCVKLKAGIEAAANARKESVDYWKEAFVKEMYNHEYGINWQGDYDVISCFGNVDGVADYEDRQQLMDAAGFTAVQRSAYEAARAEYYRSSNG